MKKIFAVLFAVVLIATSSVAALAAVSPTAPVIYKVVADAEKGGSAHTSVDIVQKGDLVILTAKKDNGYTFKSWDIDGDYEIVEGDLNSEYLVIRAKSDIHAHADFKPDSTSPTGATSPTGTTTPTKPTPAPSGKPGGSNDSPTSPQTGYDFIAYIGVSTVLLAGALLYILKKRGAKAK